MKLRALDLKAFRDLWHLRGPALAIVVVATCGVAAFVALRSMVHHLGGSQQAYYERARFGDLFAHVKRAPGAVLSDVATIPGVEAAEGRITGEVLLDVRGLAEPANGKVVGLQPDSPRRLNRVTIERGRAPAEFSTNEVVISEGFAKANSLAPGDTLGAVLNGSWRRLVVVGVGLSPEHIYTVRPGDLFADNRRYGILWMDLRAVEADFGMTGEWNDLSVRLMPGASLPDVRARLDRLLDRYGTFGAYDRERHVSHRYVSEEINQNRTSAAVIPVIFLGVAGFLLSLVLARIVASQREQIGMLKAYGCGTPGLMRHYALIALVPVGVGTIAGSALGLWVAYRIAELYQDFFRFPGTSFVPRASVFAGAALASLGAAAVGAFGAVRRVASLAPAEAMRPEAPMPYSRGLAERLRLDHIFGPVGRMTSRGLMRRPVRTGLSVLGLALGASVMIVGTFMFDAIDAIRRVQFEGADREDVAVSFAAPHGRAVLHEMQRLPGVTRVEPYRALAVRVRHRAHERQVALIGAAPGDQLRRMVDTDGRPVATPANGKVSVNAALARLLDLAVHDTVTIELLEGRRTRHELEVGAVVDDLLGTSVWAEPAVLTRLAGSDDAISGALLAADPASERDLFTRLKRMPGVTSVAVRRALMDNFDALVERSFDVTLGTLVLFACAIAVGVVYNTARITLAERARELASLRVLGFTRGEVARMLLGEQAVLTLLSLPAGAAIGALLAWGTVKGMGSTELWRMPFSISGRTFGSAILLVAAASVASGVLVRRRLDRLDLVQVLKTRE